MFRNCGCSCNNFQCNNNNNNTMYEESCSMVQNDYGNIDNNK